VCSRICRRFDDRVQRHATTTRLARMNPVDRNVLRLATYEMFFRLEVPPIVAIKRGHRNRQAVTARRIPAVVNGFLTTSRKR